MKVAFQLFGLVLSIFYSTSTLAADCSGTRVSGAQISRMIDLKYGPGASRFCKWSGVGGVHDDADVIFARVDCQGRLNGTLMVVGTDHGGVFSDERCSVSLVGDADSNGPNSFYDEESQEQVCVDMDSGERLCLKL